MARLHEAIAVYVQQHKLSVREADVVKALALQEKARTQTIARSLKISEHTVNNHLKSIFAKTETESKTEILAQLLRQACG